MTAPESSAAMMKNQLQRGQTLDAALDVMSVQAGLPAPIASHAKAAQDAAASGSHSLASVAVAAASSKPGKRPADALLEPLSEEQQKKYKAFWDQFHIQPTPHTTFFLPDGTPWKAPPVAETHPAEPAPSQLQTSATPSAVPAQATPAAPAIPTEMAPVETKVELPPSGTPEVPVLEKVDVAAPTLPAPPAEIPVETKGEAVTPTPQPGVETKVEEPDTKVETPQTPVETLPQQALPVETKEEDTPCGNWNKGGGSTGTASTGTDSSTDTSTSSASNTYADRASSTGSTSCQHRPGSGPSWHTSSGTTSTTHHTTCSTDIASATASTSTTSTTHHTTCSTDIARATASASAITTSTTHDTTCFNRHRKCNSQRRHQHNKHHP